MHYLILALSFWFIEYITFNYYEILNIEEQVFHRLINSEFERLGSKIFRAFLLLSSNGKLALLPHMKTPSLHIQSNIAADR